MAQDTLALQRLMHLGAGGSVFIILGNEGKHHRQRAPIRRPNQGLRLHAHHPWALQCQAHRAPPKGRVGLFLPLHIGQHLVRANVKGAKDHPLAPRCPKNPRICFHQFLALGHAVCSQKLQFGAKEPHALGPARFKAGQISHEPGVHIQADHVPIAGLRRLVANRGILLLRLRLHVHFVAKGLGHFFFRAQVHLPGVPIHCDRITIERLADDPLGVNHQGKCQSPRHNRRV